MHKVTENHRFQRKSQLLPFSVNTRSFFPSAPSKNSILLLGWRLVTQLAAVARFKQTKKCEQTKWNTTKGKEHVWGHVTLTRAYMCLNKTSCFSTSHGWLAWVNKYLTHLLFIFSFQTVEMLLIYFLKHVWHAFPPFYTKEILSNRSSSNNNINLIIWNNTQLYFYWLFFLLQAI